MMTDQLTDIRSLSYSHNRLSAARRDSTQTNLKIICSNDEDAIDAHAFVCAAASGRLREMLIEQNPPYRIHLKDQDVKDVRRLIDFIYTGKLEPSTPLQVYLHIADHFDVPRLTEFCIGLLRPYVYVDYVKATDENTLIGLRKFFTDVVSSVKAENIRQLFYEYFAFQPLAFCTDECLRLIPENVFRDLISKHLLFMWDGQDKIYFGKHYSEQRASLIDKYCSANGIPHKPLLDLAKVAMPKQRLIAPFDTILKDQWDFGCHSNYDNEYKMIQPKRNTYANNPSNSWRLSELKAYIVNDWAGIQPLAGFDVTYENIFTGARNTHEWVKPKELKNCTVKVAAIAPDDVIVTVRVYSGWLIDSISFVTRQGMHLGPFGESEGGNFNEIDLLGEFESTDGHTIMGLHGFEYSIIRSIGQTFWNNVKLGCATVDHSCISSKLALIESTSISAFLAKKEFIN